MNLRISIKISPCPIGHIKGNFGQSGPYVKVEANALKLFLIDKDIKYQGIKTPIKTLEVILRGVQFSEIRDMKKMKSVICLIIFQTALFGKKFLVFILDILLDPTF